MSAWPAYPQCKDSGVEWLGEVPAHWEVRRAKFFFRRMQRPVRPEDEVITAFRDGTVTLRSNRRTEGFTFSDKEIGYQGIRTGDLVIHAMDGFAGAIGVSDSDGKSTPVYSVLRPLSDKEVDVRYYAYLIRFIALSGFVTALARGIRERSTEFRYAEVKELWLPFLPLPEQQAIAAFLDRKTAEIDGLIAKKEQLIALLREKRAAVITQAVTRGLDPDVPLKDSGVAWLGEVPGHWEVKKIKHLAQLRSGESITAADINETGEYAVFGGNGVRGYTGEYTHDGSHVLIGRQGALCGNINYAQGKFWASEHAVVAHPLTCFNVLWFGELLRSMNLNQYSVSAAQPGLAVERIANLTIPVPPLEEQQAIAAFLERQIADMESVVIRVNDAVSYLREYRTALISAAVTGKVDVREIVPRHDQL